MHVKAFNRLRQGAQESLKSSLDMATIIGFVARIYSYVLFPVLLTFWMAEFLGKDDKNIGSYMIISAVVCLCLQVAFFWHMLRMDKLKGHSLEDVNTVENAYKELGIEYNRIREELIEKDQSKVYQMNCLHFISLNVESAIQSLQEFESVVLGDDLEEKTRLIGSNSNLNDALSELVEDTEKQLIWPLASLRDELFGYKSDALYNVALYRYSEKDKQLCCSARFCDDRIPRKDRSWKPGHGHVGLAFIQGEIKFCNDVESSSELKTERLDGKIVYRSFVSVPITSVDKDRESHGVLVLTSRHANQFDIDKDQIFLLLISKQISLYYTVVESLILKLNQMSVSPEIVKHQNEEVASDE